MEILKQNGAENYLPSGTYESIYLLHRVSAKVHVLAYFNCSTKVCNVVYVNPVRGNTEEIPVKKLFKDFLSENETEGFDEWEIINSLKTSSLTDGLKHIDKLFHDYKEKVKQTTFVILQSELSPERLQVMGLRTMVTDFPVIRYPLDSQDNTVMSVGWASSAF